jgi:hypothetical protein
VQHAPITLKPVAHSVGQLLTVPSAIQGHELLHSSMYNHPDVFLFHDFSERRGAAMIFAVSLYLPIIFSSVPGHGDKSTSLIRGCILQFISSQESQRTAQKAVNLFLI